MLLYLEKGCGVIDMKISSKTVIYMMRIVGTIIVMAALGLIGYLSWITSKVGLDGFLVSGFLVGAVSFVAGIGMFYISFRIYFIEARELDRDVVEKKEKCFINFNKCG